MQQYKKYFSKIRCAVGLSDQQRGKFEPASWFLDPDRRSAVGMPLILLNVEDLKSSGVVGIEEVDCENIVFDDELT